MTDQELIGYARIHCTTERALFHRDHLRRIFELAGEPGLFEGPPVPEFLAWREVNATPILDKAQAFLDGSHMHQEIVTVDYAALETRTLASGAAEAAVLDYQPLHLVLVGALRGLFELCEGAILTGGVTDCDPRRQAAREALDLVPAPWWADLGLEPWSRR